MGPRGAVDFWLPLFNDGYFAWKHICPFTWMCLERMQMCAHVCEYAQAGTCDECIWSHYLLLWTISSFVSHKHIYILTLLQWLVVSI